MQVLTSFAALSVSIAFWETIDRSFIYYHPEYKILPNRTEVLVDKFINSEEGYAISTYDPNGFRLPVPSAEASPRVLVLGDSYAQASQVSDNSTFAQQLETKLRSSRPQAGVWNAGIPGVAPSRYIGMAEYYKSTLKPDVVIVQLNAGDFGADRTNKAGTFWLEQIGDGWQVHKRDTTITRGSLKGLGRYPIVKDLATLALHSSLVQQLTFKAGQEFGISKAEKKPTEFKDDHDEVYKKHARWIVRELSHSYPQVAIVYIPSIDYFALSSSAPSQEEALDESCREFGVPYVNMRSTFIDHYKSTGNACNGFMNTTPGSGHINALGHRLVAEQLLMLVDTILKHHSGQHAAKPDYKEASR